MSRTVDIYPIKGLKLDWIPRLVNRHWAECHDPVEGKWGPYDLTLGDIYRIRSEEFKVKNFTKTSARADSGYNLKFHFLPPEFREAKLVKFRPMYDNIKAGVFYFGHGGAWFHTCWLSIFIWDLEAARILFDPMPIVKYPLVAVCSACHDTRWAIKCILEEVLGGQK